MKDVLVMTDLDQIKCISQPFRLKILESFENESATAKMISERLEEPHAKVNYHMKEMLKHNILKPIEEVVKLGVVEKYYRPVAMQFVVNSASMKLADETVRESINQYRLMIFDVTSQAFYRAIEQTETPKSLKLEMHHDVHFTDEEVVALKQALSNVLSEFAVKGEHKREGTSRYLATVLIIPDEK